MSSSPTTYEQTAAPTAAGRRVRPLHVLGGALVLTAIIVVLGAPAPWPTGDAAPATVGVGAGGDTFGPADVTVAQGETVTWQWQAGRHSVTSTGSETFDSGSKESGTFSHTFTTAGTFAYVCVWHGGMAGRVTVTPAPAASAAPASNPATSATQAVGAGSAAPSAADGTAAAATPAPKLAKVRVAGPRLRFTLSNAATVEASATTTKTPIRLGAGSQVVGDGRLLMALNRLRPGRYTVVVRARDAAGQRSPSVRVRVRVTWRLRYSALAARRAAAAKDAAATLPAAGAVVAAAASVQPVPSPPAQSAPPASSAPAAPADPVPAPAADDDGGHHSGSDSHGRNHGSGG
jgi:plastocyanin